MLLLTNGEKFEGEFKDDLIDGRGSFFTLEGEVVTGQWEGNCLLSVESRRK